MHMVLTTLLLIPFLVGCSNDVQASQPATGPIVGCDNGELVYASSTINGDAYNLFTEDPAQTLYLLGRPIYVVHYEPEAYKSLPTAGFYGQVLGASQLAYERNCTAETWLADYLHALDDSIRVKDSQSHIKRECIADYELLPANWEHTARRLPNVVLVKRESGVPYIQHVPRPDASGFITPPTRNQVDYDPVQGVRDRWDDLARLLNEGWWLWWTDGVPSVWQQPPGPFQLKQAEIMEMLMDPETVVGDIRLGRNVARPDRGIELTLSSPAGDVYANRPWVRDLGNNKFLVNLENTSLMKRIHLEAFLRVQRGGN